MRNTIETAPVFRQSRLAAHRVDPLEGLHGPDRGDQTRIFSVHVENFRTQAPLWGGRGAGVDTRVVT
jgi:hypothetical protein